MDSKSHVSTNTTTPQITPLGQQGTNNSPGGNRSSQPTHTRTYQACIPCRRRKVRCDLGPVDNPHEPPCVRCRRESKECYFSATRRKRRPQDGGEGVDDGELSDYEIRNGRKRMRSGPPGTEEHRRPDSLPMPLDRNNPSASVGGIQQPLTPGGSVGRYQPLRRPTQNQPNTNDEEDQKVNNETAAVLQTREVYSGHDALNLLFEAAGRSGDIEQHHRSGSNGSAQRPITASGNTPGSSHASYNSTQANGTRFDGRNGTQAGQNGTADTGITFTNGEMQTEEQSLQLAADSWARFRFVRAGWFTAKEAMAYLDYFYQYLSPLTPIVVPDYRHPSKHPALLTDEPMLVVTLLTIASRYMKLAGPGASSRPYAIHEKLWTYLQGMIDRMIWGQEQHGSQFMGAGAEPGCDVNPLTRKGLRTLGTVESLMLLTEWHPRALHFPPGDDGDELMAPEDRSGSNGNDSELYNGVGGARIDSWLEPCWRSDRMCWMLLGNAMSLGYEIGVFDETTEAEFQQDNPTLPKDKVHAYFRRKIHLKKLLVIYVTQTSGRLGLTSMLPRAHRAVSSPDTWDHDIQQGMGNLLRSPLLRDDDPMRSRESLTLQILHNTQDMVLDFWKQVAGMMEQGNQTLFPSRRQTRELIKSGKYIECLQGFQPKLQNFKRTYEKAIAKSSVPTHMRHILTIEFEYTRVYLNSLALQAVVERCTHNTPMQAHAQPPTSAPPSNSSKSDGGAIPFSTLAMWYGGDRYYIREVIDACRSVLRTVVEGLYPGDYLKHAPVRTWFRIISVAMILLKTFALGATEDDVAISLGLMDKAVEALRVCIVDDVHVGNRFADLLETLTSRIRSRFVRMAANGTSRAASGSPAPQTGQQTPVMPPPPQPGHHLWSGFSSNGLPSPSLGATAGGRQTPNHPLWGISTETYDPSANNISIMPPPTFGPYDHHANNANHNTHYDNTNVKHFPGVNQMDDAQTNGNGGYQSDWLALPLDPLINNYGADVTASSYGPDVGGYDLLDVLLEGMGGTA